MIKTLLLSLAALVALPLSGLADLGLSKAQIETKYGKGIDDSEAVCYPASVKDANGKVLKRPEAYSLAYRDVSRNLKVLVHFNSKGIATDVEYRTDGEFTNDDLRYFTQINGFTNKTILSDYPDWWGGDPFYPLDDKGNFISVFWGDTLDAQIARLTGEKATTKPSMIDFRTAESITDQFVTTREQWDEFNKAVQGHPEMQKDVVRKTKDWMDKGASK
jgi:hypothetical protein